MNITLQENVVENGRKKGLIAANQQSEPLGKAVKERISACFLCAGYCGVVISLDENDKVVRVVGDKDNPNTKGFICNKGVNLHSLLDSPHRLTKPLKRVNGELVEVSWDEALQGIGKALKRIRKNYSARAVSLAVGGSENHTMEALTGVLMLNGLGSRSFYSPSGLEFLGRWLTSKKMYGVNIMDGHPDFEHSKYIIVVGGNPLVSCPPHGPALKKAAKDKQRTLVVVDPRRTETAALADSFLNIRPSTDIYFLLCLLNTIISEQLYDKAHVARYSVGLEAVRSAVKAYTPEYAETMTGIEASLIKTIAIDFAKAESGVLYYHMGVIANRHGTLVSWAVQAIKFITNNKGRKGGSLINPLILDLNKLEKLSEKVKKYRSRINPKFEEISSSLPTIFLPDEILTRGEGQIRAMIVSGCNPLKAYGQCKKMDKAFDDLELLVSIDPFLTEVGRKAHYVLPSCGFQEQENLSFPHSWLFKTPFIQLLHKIREPLGDSWPEWKIYRGILKHTGAQGVDNHIINGIFSLLERLHRWRRKPGEFNQQLAIVKLMARFSDTTWDELNSNPHGFTLSRKKPYNYLEQLETEDKKVHLAIPEFLQSIVELPHKPSAVDKDFPLLLNTSCRNKANTNTLFHNNAWQDKHGDGSKLVVHPDDLAGLGIEDNGEGIEKVRLISQNNQAIVIVSLSRDVVPGSVHLSHGWGLISRDPNSDEMMEGVSAGDFVSDFEYEEFTAMPLLSGIPCRIEGI